MSIRLLIFSCLWACSACTAIKPVALPTQALTQHATFSHEDFDRVLRRFVNDAGQVDYAALKNNLHDLDRYYFRLSTCSPDRCPKLVPTADRKLAYWINAYNAATIKAVLTHYPISSVEDVTPPFPFFFLPNKSGFFLFQEVTFGGKTTSLYALEHRLIRKRYPDPRVHFALNCASGGCPRLPMYAFSAEELDAQLDHETRKFLAEKRNLRIDHQKKIVYLSSIFDWYEDDFLTWYNLLFPGHDASLLDYAVLYTSPEQGQELQRAAAYEIRFLPYDWRLNDSKEKPVVKQ